MKLQRSFFAVILVLLVCRLMTAQELTVYSGGERPDDIRLQPLKDLNGYFPFEVPTSVAAWERRREELRDQVLLATGLWPDLPERTPMNAVIHGKVHREGFTAEKVYFESVPGHFVTGLLFRPAEQDKSKKYPAVLCPHGHGGRMQDYGEGNMDALIESGAEKFRASGRFPKIARCAHLARMGCVVFIFDMLGYEDSQQISNDLAHRFRTQRPELDTEESWGFFSCQAESRLQSIMGVQTWNSIRCLDFLEQLPDVDPERIAVTGGSGGGTQTILLCAIDDRPIAAFPNGMVSTAMQGGCTCENCSMLRVGTGNVELAALFAPKPQAMTAADDWTKDMMTKGYPELQELYSMLGAADDVYCRPLLQFPHNYNYVSRQTMYAWFNKHLKLDCRDLEERDYLPLTKEEAAVWNSEHPKPEGGIEHELSLTKYLGTVADKQLEKLLPSDATSYQVFRETIGKAFRLLIARELPEGSQIERVKGDKVERDDHYLFTDRIRFREEMEELPLLSIYPKTTSWSGDVVIWLDGAGKQSLLTNSGGLSPSAQEIIQRGTAIVSADLFMQGEFLADGGEPVRQRSVKNPRQAASYTFCYNPTLFAQRVHDILTVVSYITYDEHAPKRVLMVARNGTGPVALAARALIGDKVNKLVADTEGFRFGELKDYLHPQFLPGARRYGDLPALAGLNAPDALQLIGEDTKPDLAARCYESMSAEKELTLGASVNLNWLLK